MKDTNVYSKNKAPHKEPPLTRKTPRIKSDDIMNKVDPFEEAINDYNQFLNNPKMLVVDQNYKKMYRHPFLLINLIDINIFLYLLYLYMCVQKRAFHVYV